MGHIVFGNCWENFGNAPADGMKALAGMNLSFIRVFVMWHLTNPSPGQYDWTKIDADIAAVRGAGLQVYANILWAPTFASQNQPTYLPYTQGCAEWVDPNDGSKGIKFASDKSYCVTPAHIDPSAIQDFGAQLAKRYGSEITWYSHWNEPGGSFYWPAVQQDGMETGIQRLVNEVLIPFTNGVRSVTPNAQIVGCEADSGGVLDQALTQEQNGKLQLFDAITFHPYSWGVFPDDSYKRIDNEFMPAANARRNGRPIYYSEIGDDGTGKIVEWTQNVALSRDVSLICFYDPTEWFEKGTWDNGTYVPNTLYTQMRDFIASLSSHGRPVGAS